MIYYLMGLVTLPGLYVLFELAIWLHSIRGSIKSRIKNTFLNFMPSSVQIKYWRRFIRKHNKPEQRERMAYLMGKIDEIDFKRTGWVESKRHRESIKKAWEQES